MNLSSSSLLFTPANWNVPQIVTLSIPDDATAAPNRIETLTHTIVSTLPEFALDALADVQVFVTDASGLPPAGSITGNTSIGSSTYPNGGLFRLDQARLNPLDGGMYAGQFDPTNNLITFGMDEPFVQQFDADTLIPKEAARASQFFTKVSAIDTADGYVYYGMDRSPAAIAKIRLGDFKVMSELNLPAGENRTQAMVMDKGDDMLYVITNTTPTKIVKINASTMTRVAAYTDTTGGFIIGLAIDETNNRLYYGKGQTIKQINTDTMSVVASTNIQGTVGFPNLSSISIYHAFSEPVDGKVYFIGSNAGNDILIGWNTTTQEVSSAELTAVGGDVQVTLVHPGLKRGYAIDYDQTMQIVDLQTGALISTKTIPANTNGAALNTVANEIVFGDYNGAMSKYSLTTESVTLSRPTNAVEENPRDMTQDPDGAFLYTLTSNQGVVKVNKDTMQRLEPAFSIRNYSPDYNTFNLGTTSILYDNVREAVYVGAYGTSATTANGGYLRVNPATMSATGELRFGQRNQPVASTMESDGSFAYVATAGVRLASVSYTNARIYKIDLNTFTIDSVQDIGVDIRIPRGLYLNEATDSLYTVAFPNTTLTNKTVYKIDTNTLAVTATHNLVGQPQIIDYDLTLDRLYLSDGTILNGSDLTTVVDQPTVLTGWDFTKNRINSDLYPVTKFNATNPSQVGLFQRSSQTLLGNITLDNYEESAIDAIYDVARGAIFTYHDVSAATIVKTLVGFRGALWGTKMTLSGVANTVDSLRVYAHTAGGNLQASLYDANKNLVWSSASIPTAADNTWYTVSIADGTPNALTNLAAGDYYLVFQTDSPDFRPGYTQGTQGDGFVLQHPFGTPPNLIQYETTTDRRFSMAMVVNVGSSLTETSGSTIVVEGTAGDSYSIVLNSQPSGNVVVNINNPGGVTLSASSLTFTPDNWNVPQSVNISLTDTGVREGNRTVTLTHSFVTTDPYYFSQTLRDVTISVQDPAATVTIAPSSPYLGGGGGFTVAPNSLGEYLAGAEDTMPNLSSPEKQGTTNPTIPTIDLGGNKNPGITTRPAAPTDPSGEPQISLCEIQKQNLLRGTNISVDDIEESDFRTLVRDFGLIISDEEGATDPMREVTRSEILRLILQTQCGAFTIPKSKDAPFPDVPKFHKDALYIGVAKIQDIVTGYLSDGTFKPDNSISRAEALKIVLEVLFRKSYPHISGDQEPVPADIAPDAWFYRYMTFAAKRGIIDAETLFRPMEPATKNDIAHFLLEGVKVLSLSQQR